MEWLFLIIVPVLVFVGFCVLAWHKSALGLVLMPFVIIGMIVSGLIYFEGEIVEEGLFLFLLALFLFPVTIGIVRWSPSDSPLETPWHKAFAGVVITLFQYIIILAILSLIFNVLGPILFALFVIAVARFKQTNKYSLALEIISAIGMSMRQSLPLPMALNSAAHGQKPKESKIFTNIAHWLSQGQPLSEAMRRGYPKCPPEILASISAAEKMNQLPNAIETIQADIAEKVNYYKGVRPDYRWYPVVIGSAALLVTLGLMYFIVPVFSEVLSDMSDGMAGLPALTQALLYLSLWLKGRSGLNFLMIVIPVTLMPYVIYTRFRRRSSLKQRLLSRIGDFLRWHLPIFHWFEQNYSQLQLIEILKVGLRAGYPVNTLLRNSLELDMNHCYRKRIQQWLGRIEKGDNIAQSALKSGIGKTLAWAMDDSVNKGNAPLILESLEEVYRGQYNYRLNLLNAVACPLTVIGLGACVGLVVTAMFLPMVKMIEIMLW